MDVTCVCGTVFPAKTSRAKWCSPACKKRHQRGSAKVVELPVEREDGAEDRDDAKLGFTGGVYRATRIALEDADRLDTPVGQMCLVLARRLDFPALDTGSAISSLAARLEQLLASATRGTGQKTAPQQLQDELAERRAKHGA